jgi:hypothetical protein
MARIKCRHRVLWIQERKVWRSRNDKLIIVTGPRDLTAKKNDK